MGGSITIIGKSSPNCPCWLTSTDILGVEYHMQVVNHCALNVLSRSVMDFQEKVWIGGGWLGRGWVVG